MRPDFSIRPATRDDAALILSFIRSLADYEKLTHEVTATEEALQATLFGDHPAAETLLAFEGEAPVGFALFFHNYSTFLGKPGIYLEDLFVKPEYRNHGYGKALLARLARIAVERECGRFEWSVLDWNKSSINFYRSLGGKPLEDWSIFRVDGEALKALARP